MAEKTVQLLKLNQSDHSDSGIDNDIYSQLMLVRMHVKCGKTLERLKQEPATVTEDDEMSKEKEIDKLMALFSFVQENRSNLQQQPSNFTNTSRAIQDKFLQELQKRTWEYGHVLMELNAEQADWKDDTDDDSEEQELKHTYILQMGTTSEVTPDSVDTSRTNLNDEPMHKDKNNNDNYNVFAMKIDILSNLNLDDQDETDDLDQERDLLASLIQKLKCEIDDSKN
ncbi:hypothetical protein Tco_0518333 [Tanacetum coccineum]